MTLWVEEDQRNWNFILCLATSGIRNQKGTRLSRHIWTLKDNQPYPVPFELEWDILGKEKPFNPVTGVCRLCLLEAYILMFDDVNTEHYP